MTQPDDVSWPCRITGTSPGPWIPVRIDDPSGQAIPATGLTLVVFTTPAEASAYTLGLGDAPGPATAATGSGLLASVVAVALPGPSRLCDHGGLPGLRHALTWRWIEALASGPNDTDRIHVEINVDGAPLIEATGRRLWLEDDAGDVLVCAEHALPTHILRDALRRQSATSWADIAIDKTRIALRIAPDALLRRPDTLTDIAAALAEAESQVSEETLTEWVRRDPKHRAVFERMREGWRLVRFDSTGHLVPPAGDPRPGRVLNGAMIARLLRAGLIRRPVHIETLYRRDPWRTGQSDGTYAYVMGSLRPLDQTQPSSERENPVRNSAAHDQANQDRSPSPGAR